MSWQGQVSTYENLSDLKIINKHLYWEYVLRFFYQIHRTIKKNRHFRILCWSVGHPMVVIMEPSLATKDPPNDCQWYELRVFDLGPNVSNVAYLFDVLSTSLSCQSSLRNILKIHSSKKKHDSIQRKIAKTLNSLSEKQLDPIALHHMHENADTC